MVVGTTSLLLAAVGPVWADRERLNQNDVLRLVEQGTVLPLEQILQRHRDRLQGRLIDLELEQEHGRWVYELELIDSRNVVREYLIDAQTNQWLGEDD